MFIVLITYNYSENILIGRDWNHGMDYDFPFSWEWKIIPTDELIFFRGVETTNQYYIYMVEAAVWNIMKHVMIVTVFIYHYQYIEGF